MSQAAAAAPQPRRQQGQAATPPAQQAAAATAPARKTQPHSQEEQRRTGSTAAALGRLTAATALLCTLNGAAAYTYVTSEAGQVNSVVNAQQESLQAVSTIVAAGPQNVQSLRSDTSAAAGSAFTQDLATGATEITASAARAASGPAAFESDIPSLTTLSGAYTTYAGMLEQARTAPTDAAATKLLTQSTSYRTNQIDPVVASLGGAYSTRSDGADVASAMTTGFLGATTLASLVALVGGATWLARRTKRIINPGLIGGALATAAVSAYAFSTLMTNPPVPNGPWTAPAVLLGGLAAAGMAWAGLEQRRKEYR